MFIHCNIPYSIRIPPRSTFMSCADLWSKTAERPFFTYYLQIIMSSHYSAIFLITILLQFSQVLSDHHLSASGGNAAKLSSIDDSIALDVSAIDSGVDWTDTINSQADAAEGIASAPPKPVASTASKSKKVVSSGRYLVPTPYRPPVAAAGSYGYPGRYPGYLPPPADPYLDPYALLPPGVGYLPPAVGFDPYGLPRYTPPFYASLPLVGPYGYPPVPPYYGLPPPVADPYGLPPPLPGSYGLPPPIASPYGLPPPLADPYGLPPPIADPYGLPPPIADPYGLPPPIADPYGLPPPIADPYGLPPPIADPYGLPPPVADPYGLPPLSAYRPPVPAY